MRQAFLSWQQKSKSFFKKAYLSVKTSPYRYGVLKRDFEFRKIIRNQRVLIIGSGLSANELNYIPKNVRILTCNVGPRILLTKGINRQIDLYFCATGTMVGGHKNENVIELLSKLKINLFVIGNKKLIKDNIDFKIVYDKCIDKCIKDKGTNNYYLNRLIGQKKVEEIKSDIRANNRTSTGLRLLQYALYFKAKEIYLVGIDINEEGYFWGRKNANDHLFIDKDFIELVSKKYKHIYSAAKSSPIVRYLKYKPLLD